MPSRAVTGIRRRLARGDAQPRAHLIHLPKTGGSSLKQTLRPLAHDGRYELHLHLHATRLEDVPVGDKVFFVLRDPVERFVSGFNQRLRQGRPHRYNPWKPDEEIAFQMFSTANELAEALSSPDSERYDQALYALSVIKHVRDPYWYWFRHLEYLRERRDDLLMIQWLPDLDATFPTLVDLLGLPAQTQLREDTMASNRTPGGYARALTPLATSNLERWLARDHAFIGFCAEFDCFIAPSWSPGKPLARVPQPALGDLR